MRKLTLLVALIAILFTACRKDTPVGSSKTYVKAIAGSYLIKNGDLQLKAAPVGANVNLGMLTDNVAFYSNPGALGGKWSKVDGREFRAGSVANVFWANGANNFGSFPFPQPGVFSNQTPDENVRVVAETRDANNAVIYLGMVDFRPTAASFPLTINGFRLGDELVVNANAIKNLPGGQYLTITASFNLAPIKLLETETKVALSGTHSLPSGTQFEYTDIVYGTAVATTVTIGAGDFSALNTLSGKIIGDITITLSETGVPYQGNTTIVKTIAASGAGAGLKLTLTTSRIGWFDSGTMVWNNADITITPATLAFN